MEQLQQSNAMQSTQCYICYDDETPSNPYAKEPPPCICKGSIFIHQSCLKKVIQTSKFCTICKTKYNLKYLPQRNGRELMYEFTEYNELVEYTINQSGQKHGQYIIRSQAGEIVEAYNYTNGVFDGPFVEYYNSGKMKKLGTYKNGHLEGEYTEWYESGDLYEEAFYFNGQKHGKCTMYVKEGGVLIGSSQNYINGDPLWF